MKRYKVIAADTKHFKSLFKDYSEIMHVVTYPIQNCIAELEDNESFLILLNGEKVPDTYIKNIN